MKLDILAFAAHPDDTELSCGGTLIKHIKQGRKVGVIDLTEGQLGSRGSVELRYKEAARSAEITGLSVRENLQMEDGWFRNDEASVRKLIEAIRAYQPEIVLANAIQDRHPDHGRGAKLAADACFYSGLVKIETAHNGEPQKAWRPKALYHYIQDYHIEPDFVIDVSEEWDKKVEAIMAFSSQFYDPNSKEAETPISSKDFMQFLEARAQGFGRPIGAKFGEGFTKSRYIGVKDLFDLS